jgi:hypothetical protein
MEGYLQRMHETTTRAALRTAITPALARAIAVMLISAALILGAVGDSALDSVTDVNSVVSGRSVTHSEAEHNLRVRRVGVGAANHDGSRTMRTRATTSAARLVFPAVVLETAGGASLTLRESGGIVLSLGTGSVVMTAATPASARLAADPANVDAVSAP